MTIPLWILSGVCLGCLLGVIITNVWMRELLTDYYNDMENHRHAAMEMSQHLAKERRENERLTEQIDSLLKDIDQPDPAEFWQGMTLAEAEKRIHLIPKDEQNS